MPQTLTVSFSMTLKSNKDLDKKLLRYFREKVLPKVPNEGEQFRNDAIHIINAVKSTAPKVTKLSKEKAVQLVKDFLHTKAIRYAKQHKRPGVVKFFGLVPPTNMKKGQVSDYFDNVVEELNGKGIRASLIHNESGIRSIVISF